MTLLTNQDLKLYFHELVANHFSELHRPNSITIKFGRHAKRRLGSIWYDKNNQTSVITITRYLSNPNVPSFVIKAVLAHELVHYFTGFGSSHEKKYEHAHRGSVMKREMSQYGLYELYQESEKWVKQNWTSVIRRNSRYNAKVIVVENELIQIHENVMTTKRQIRLF